ncbi:hypothetical protein IG631_11268 [Alternaria alternata]|nr:hypothetical protein IG631_11268 [Alternaria alternata]
MQPRCPQQQRSSTPEFLNPKRLHGEVSARTLRHCERTTRHAYKLRAVSGVAALTLSPRTLDWPHIHVHSLTPRRD